MAQFTTEQVAQMLADTGVGVKGSRSLIINNGTMSLVHRLMLPPSNAHITTFSQTELREGLTSRRWDGLEKKLKEYNDKHPA